MSLTAVVALFAQTVVPVGVSAPAQPQIPPPARSCRLAAGNLDGSGATLPAAVDGRKLKAFWQIAALRRNAAPGQIIVIDGGDFSRQKIGAIDLSAVCFRGTRLVDTVWAGTKGLGIGFINADLSGARLENVSFDSVLFRNTTLARVNASGARLVFGQLDGGWSSSIANLTLDNAQMIGFRFICGSSANDGCSFDRKQISMRGTNLSEAKLSSFAFWDTAFEGATINRTEIGLDQLTLFHPDNIKGPLLIRHGAKSIALSQSDYPALRAKLAVEDGDPCRSGETAVLKLICGAASTDLLRLHRDIAALQARATTIVKPADQKAYLTKLDACATREPATANDCARDEMARWRDSLMTGVQQFLPLERNSRALFVSNDTAYVATDIAALAPLLAGAASSYVLARSDAKGKLLDVRAVANDAAGNRCVHADSIKRGQQIEGFALRIWSGGADFSKTAGAATGTACTATLQSGPLMRIPVSDADFDALWAGASG